jgi:hypothetical protein
MTNRHLSVLAILLLLPFCNTCSAQVADSTTIIKAISRCWRAFSHEYSNIYGLEEEEIKRYSKQRVCIGKDSVSMYYSTVYTPKYSFKKVNAEDYAKNNFDFSKRKLGIIVDSVYEITIKSATKPAKNGNVYKMTDVVAYDGECLYIVADGVIFKMVDADAKVKPSTSN